MSITIEGLTHIYDKGSPFETIALDSVNLEIQKGEFIGLIGHTGSGKSTLIQHMNGLLKPSRGKIFVDGLDITAKKTNLNDVRKKVGLVFQYPEYQLFEETVYKDIAFGPLQLGLKSDEVEERIIEAMGIVGLDYTQYKDLSPFELSGGQKRRVAIAGVVAMKPDVLILDEPTAGLDPIGREEVLRQIKGLHDTFGTTVILVSHSMEEVARFADRIIVMDCGTIALSGKPAEVFKHAEKLKEIGLGIPQVTQLFHILKAKGFNLKEDVFTVEQGLESVLGYIRSKKDA
jgi:energy-coupling factor transport system ATP-binding protein